MGSEIEVETGILHVEDRGIWFRYLHTETKIKGMNRIRRRMFTCSECTNSCIAHDKLTSHADKHVRRMEREATKADRAYSAELARECGMSAPIAGQLGIDVLGVGEVKPKEKKPPKPPPAKPRKPKKEKAEKAPSYKELAAQEQKRLYDLAMQNSKTVNA